MCVGLYKSKQIEMKKNRRLHRIEDVARNLYLGFICLIKTCNYSFDFYCCNYI
jgi:hypothetical protein